MTTASETRLEIETASPAETMALAARLATVAEAGDLICIRGELGAGKTVFAKGFGAGLGVTGTISSPSFVLMAEYAGRLPLFHIDLYRLDEEREVETLGLEEIFEKDAVVLIEWGERFPQLLPEDRVEIRLESLSPEARRIEIVTRGVS